MRRRLPASSAPSSSGELPISPEMAPELGSCQILKSPDSVLCSLFLAHRTNNNSLHLLSTYCDPNILHSLHLVILIITPR